ncbi:MAG: hypothetical protein K0S41_2270 [Anaerocolumna sp.]|jgi:sortase B|nr:hypothetical protein [Anaerocolumna sp.]
MNKINQNLKKKLLTVGQIIAMLTFFISVIILINEQIIQPYHSKKVIEKTQQLYYETLSITASNINNLSIISKDSTNETNNNSTNNSLSPNTSLEDSNTSVTNTTDRDSKGRLLKFTKLLETNEDVKGWISIEGTNINYPVLQSDKNDPELYLTRNIKKELDKCGSIFIDVNSSVEQNTKNLVLHGHNMTSTDNMFHYLPEYKNLEFYQKHSIISFDTIYELGDWKIISIFITDASNKADDFFNYLKATFKDDSDFLNFIYQLRTRSIINCPVDVNEDDQILTLSTCSYELDNYRTVIVARKVRDGELNSVAVKDATKNENPLYPKSFYDYYGGHSPNVTTFEEALKEGTITWYK